MLALESCFDLWGCLVLSFLNEVDGFSGETGSEEKGNKKDTVILRYLIKLD